MKDDRDIKNEEFKTFTDDNETKSPLGKLFRQLMPSLRAQYKAGKVHGGRDPARLKKLPPPPTRALVPRLAVSDEAKADGAAKRRKYLSNEASTFDTMVACSVSNYACAQRELHVGELDWAALGLTGEIDADALALAGITDVAATLRTLQAGVEAVPDFAGKPLAPVDVAKYVTRTSAQRVASALPFDVRRHPHAQSAVAESMMARLEADMERLAKTSESSTVAELRTHDGEPLSKLLGGGTASAVSRFFFDFDFDFVFNFDFVLLVSIRYFLCLL